MTDGPEAFLLGDGARVPRTAVRDAIEHIPGMPRTCTVCRHAERALIDKALVDNATVRDIARQFAVSKDAVQRHRMDHLPRAITLSKAAEETVHGTDLLSEVQDLNNHTLAILAKAERRGDLKIALSAIGEVRKNKELLARLKGELEQKPERVTANVRFQMTSNQIASEPLLVQWIARNRRLPTAEERQQLLTAEDSAKVDEPPEEG